MQSMRTALIALALAASSSTVAQAQSMEGVARTVGVFIAIKSACGRLTAIDQDKATRYAVGIIGEGRRRYGTEAFDEAIAVEAERRREEVDATGAQQWCTYQRGYLKSMGMTGIFLR